MATTVLTNTGEGWIVDRLVGTGGDSALDGHFVGWGTGAGTSAKGDTTLFTEDVTGGYARAAGTVSKTGAGATAKYQVVATLTALAALTITNAGNFTAVTAGTLIVKGDFTGVVLATGDSIQFTITLDPS
jgi:hypothetical protein